MNDKQHIFDWILRILTSCNNTFQIECAKVMIDLFECRFKDDYLTTELRLRYTQQYNSIHSILN